MKRLIHTFGLTLLSACFAMQTGHSYGQHSAVDHNDRTHNRTGAPGRLGDLDTTTDGTALRASQLIGMAIENSQEQDVGTVSDLVLNSRNGRVSYVAVTYGGFLGMGNKMFAVPFEAFRVTTDPDDPNDTDDLVLVLDVTQQQLDGATGFDENTWPDFADRNFTSGLDKRYGVDRTRRDRRMQRRGAGVGVTVGPNGVDVDVDRHDDHDMDRDRD